ncbi:MAG: cytochrome P450 [Gemmatimonadales bacterium]
MAVASASRYTRRVHGSDRPGDPSPRPTGRLTTLRLLRDLPALRRSPPDLFVAWRERYGDVVRIPLARPLMVQVHSPEDIRHVLVAAASRYRKAGGERSAARLLGRGLLRSRGELYRRQRALIEPSFYRPKLAAMAEAMAAETRNVVAEWDEGELDLSREMSVLTLRVLVRALFGADWRGEAATLVEDILVCQRLIHPTTLVVLPRWIPTPGRLRYERAIARIDQLAAALIDGRRRTALEGDDLLTMLVRTRDAEGSGLSDKQLRDEVVGMLVAGHGTTATGLSWMWHEVLKRPDLVARIRAEVDEVAAPDRLPGAELPRQLELVEAAFREALRLHPPVWAIGRRAIADDRLPSGMEIPAGSIVNIFPYVVQRRADLFPEPLEFRPERFLRSTRPTLTAGSFIPFGAGPRSCLGEGFAMLEATIIVAEVVRRFDLQPRETGALAAETLLVRRPRGGVWVRARRRPATPTGPRPEASGPDGAW